MKAKQWKNLLLKVKMGLEGLWVPVVNQQGRNMGTLRVVKDLERGTTIAFVPVGWCIEEKRLVINGSIDKQAKKAAAFFEEFIGTTDVPEYTIITT